MVRSSIYKVFTTEMGTLHHRKADKQKKRGNKSIRSAYYNVRIDFSSALGLKREGRVVVYKVRA